MTCENSGALRQVDNLRPPKSSGLKLDKLVPGTQAPDFGSLVYSYKKCSSGGGIKECSCVCNRCSSFWPGQIF